MKKREFITLIMALFLIQACSKETEFLDTKSEEQTIGNETPTTSTCECNDGIDNDGDGLVDWMGDLGCTGTDDCSEGGLATGSIENGWMVIEPTSNTRIYYVSTTDGDDQNDGRSPNTPKKTIAAAMVLARNNSPDWVLLKRGDVFSESLTIKEGVDANSPFVIASYGDSKDRPLLKTGANSGIQQVLQFQNIIISGLAFYAHTRNPQSNEFVSYQGSTGFNFYRKAGKPGNNLTIEDCSFNFYAGNVIQGAQPPQNITLRRNIFTNNYSDTAHSQGVYMAFCDSVLLEENIFDHNGWLIQAIPPFNNVKANGQATYFNHNFYGTSLKNTTLIGNVFSRGSSIGTKFTADNGPGSASNIVIDNNLYIDGEIGISIGGNDFNASYRFKDINIANNIMLDIGKSKSTTRGLAWYIDIDDWDNGIVEKNLLLHQADSQIGNTFGINIAGVSRDITIQENIIHGLKSGLPLISSSDNNADKSNVLITKNDVVAPSNNAVLMGFPSNVSNYTFLQNTYYSTSSANNWFQIGTTYSNITAWENLTNDSASTTLPIYKAPDRTIEVYQTSLGKSSSIDGFITEITKQSKFNWNADYNALSVNNWFREGFNLKTLSN